jgi:ABC-type lipoprotein release transport system permease subunit
MSPRDTLLSSSAALILKGTDRMVAAIIVVNILFMIISSLSMLVSTETMYVAVMKETVEEEKT